MKLAAIDIGSNAVRLYIARPLHEDQVGTDFKHVEFTRLPLRLGDDVFSRKEIGKVKSELLVKALQAFGLLMEIWNVDEYRACATSAMRDATNAVKLCREIKKLTGIKVEVISGKEESRLIQCAVLDWIPARNNFLHIDVGGGSTEVALIVEGKIMQFESFNIGTVRMREGKVKATEKKRMQKWLSLLPKGNTKAVGTGGNIVKLHELAGTKPTVALNLQHLISIHGYIESLSQHDRVYEMKLNPDRAEVIGHAGNIFIEIMTSTDIHEVFAPDLGLKDGMVKDLWKRRFEAVK